MSFQIVGGIGPKGFFQRLKQLFFPRSHVFQFKISTKKNTYRTYDLKNVSSIATTLLSEFYNSEEVN